MSTEDTLPFVTQRLSTNWLKATIRDKSPSMMICPLDKASESCHKPQLGSSTTRGAKVGFKGALTSKPILSWCSYVEKQEGDLFNKTSLMFLGFKACLCLPFVTVLISFCN